MDEKLNMSALSRVKDPSPVERELHERAAAAKIRLRFDKSVLRLLDGVKAALADTLPKGQSVIFTVTAPIRRRAKTADAIVALVRGGLAGEEVRASIEDNEVRVRLLRKVPAQMPRVVGFVHNPESDAGALLALAEARLLGRVD